MDGYIARIRRWWWGVNNWSIPDGERAPTKGGNRFISPNDTKLAAEVQEVSPLSRYLLAA